MSERLSFANLARVPADVARPGYDVASLGVGIVHLGLGAFHRAHQAVFTEDAVRAAGGDWGIAGVSLRHGAAPAALTPQDGLYAVETLAERSRLRVVGVIRRAMAATDAPEAVLDAMAARTTHIISLTVTEKAYRLDAQGALDLAHPDIVHDLAKPARPVSAVGWLTLGLARRKTAGGAPATVICCDNLIDNGRKLGEAVRVLADRWDPALSAWIETEVAFPGTMVDCITPAATDASRARIEARLGLCDRASVSRETFAQWVIEDRFAGPHPAWERAGAELVADVAHNERLKLHVLNAAHSAVAYLGLERGLGLVREAIADADLSAFLEALMAEEIGPALPDLPVADYWRAVRARFANPMLDHRLVQIGEDGSSKLAQRIHPLLIANARAGRPGRRLAMIVRSWLRLARRGKVADPLADHLRGAACVLDDPALFAAPFRDEPAVRRLLAEVDA